jgi:hypothetical protein
MTNAEKKAAWGGARRGAGRQKNAASMGGSTPGDVVPGVASPGADVPEVEVKMDDTPQPKLSLKDRFIQRLQGSGGDSSSPKPKARSRGKKDDNLMVTMLPTVIASFVAMYSRQLVHDPYKSVAPSQDEVGAILGPIFEIIGRRIEVVGKVSQDAIDLSNALVCGLMYGVRAYVTYVQIREMEEGISHGEQVKPTSRRSSVTERDTGYSEPAEPATLAAGMRGYQAQTTRPYGDGVSVNVQPPTQTEGDGAGGHDDTQDGDSQGRDREVALVAQMFKRDKLGRQQMGLLPRE